MTEEEPGFIFSFPAYMIGRIKNPNAQALELFDKYPLTLGLTIDGIERRSLPVFTDKDAAKQYIVDNQPKELPPEKAKYIRLIEFEESSFLIEALTFLLQKNPNINLVVLDPWKPNTNARAIPILDLISDLSK